MIDCTHPIVANGICANCHERVRLAPAGSDVAPFCSICLEPGPDLKRAPDGKLECGDCRDLSPRTGRYSFTEGSSAERGTRHHKRRGT